MKMTETMKTTLRALSGYESMIGAGTTTGEVTQSGGSASSLRTAIGKGWVNRYSKERHSTENRSPAYYLTTEGEAALAEN